MSSPTLTASRVLAAVFVGLLGSVTIWWVVPYNNFWLQNSFVSDHNLPEVVIGLLLLLVLVINPLLRLAGPGWMLDRRQIALVGSILLFAAVLPSNGLMRMFPHVVAKVSQDVNANLTTAKVASESDLPQALFVDPMPTRDAEGNVVVKETPNANQFLDELEEGHTIPWKAWVVPFASWGMLIIALWAMMVGLGGVVFPQWRDRERLPFPLLNVYHAFIGDKTDPPGRVLPPVFASRMFWVAVISVFLIHGLRGLNAFTGSFPSFPLEWRLDDFYQDSILRHSVLAYKFQVIFFAVVGVAYFIPSRYAISIWGIVLIQGAYIIFGRAYVPAFNDGQVQSQSFGALLAIAVWVLWLGRSHWVQVGRAMLGKGRGGPENRRDAVAGWMFAIGCAGIVLWLNWAGCSLWWSLLAMAGCALISLLIARIIAETGIPVLWIGRFSVQGLTAFFPLAWQSPSILFCTGIIYALVTRTTAVSAAVITTLAMGMDREASPKYRSRLLLGGLGVLALGFVICGAIHLHMGYNFSDLTTNPKTGATTINDWTRVDRTDFNLFTADRGQQAVGFGLGTAMLWACSRFPSWPFHPVGLLFCQLSIGNLLWFSVFLGWLIKVGVTGIFGGGAYRKARPLFLGLIMGELLAVIVWALVPVVIVLVTGADPVSVPRYTIMQYP